MFTSKYTDKKITAAQLIAERLCELIAAQKKTSLVQQFWQDDLWKKVFSWQVVLANRLLKKWSQQALLEALSMPENKRITSLATVRFQNTVAERQKKIDSMAKKVYDTIEVAEPTKPREAFSGGKSVLTNLGDL